MKEFPLSLTEFHKGLRRTDRDTRGRGTAVQLDNARIDDEGLTDFEAIVNPFANRYLYDQGISTEDFPFPQLIKGKSKTFLCTRHNIYEVTRGTIGTWTVSRLDLYDAYSTQMENYSFYAPGAIASGNAWQLIDFFDTWLLINGSSTVFFMEDKDNLLELSDRVTVENSVSINAGTYHEGRAIFGGFNTSNFWNDEWREFWIKWLNSGISRSQDSLGLDSNYIMWTTVGAQDLLYQFYPSLAQTGVISGSPYGVAEPLMFEMLKRGDCGFMPMSWQGTVQNILPLGSHLMVYGSDGVSAIKPMVDPIPTYGEQVVSTVGIANVGAVAGDSSQHMFVDKKGYLWRVTSQGYERLGYKEYFSDMSSPITAHYNDNDKEFYFSDGQISYVFNKGLSAWWQPIYSAFYDSGSVIGIVKNMVTGLSQYGSGTYGSSYYS